MGTGPLQSRDNTARVVGGQHRASSRTQRAIRAGPVAQQQGPDGRRILTASADETARVREADMPAQRASRAGPALRARRIAPMGVASSPRAGTRRRVGEADTGRLVAEPMGLTSQGDLWPESRDAGRL